jgi:hypothetical protein
VINELGRGLWYPASLEVTPGPDAYEGGASHAPDNRVRFVDGAHSPQWLLANTVVGLACIPLVLWLSKQGAAAPDSPRTQRFVRDIAGLNLSTAQSFLKTLAEFESEGNHRTSV